MEQDTQKATDALTKSEIAFRNASSLSEAMPSSIQTVRQTIVSDERLRQALEKIPELIQRIQRKRDDIESAEYNLKYDVSVNNVKEEVKQVESEIAYEVNQEIDPNSRKFSKPKEIDAEVEARYSVDENVIKNIERMDVLRGPEGHELTDDEGKEIKELQEANTLIYNKIKSEVESEPDPKKRLFTNDTARQAEINRRLNESKDYAAVLARLNAASMDRGRAEMEVAKNRNSLSALYEELRTERDIVGLATGLAQEKSLASILDDVNEHGRQIIINLNDKSRGNGNV